jgi:hypothetical protein
VHWVSADGQSRTGIVGDQTLLCIHLLERQTLFAFAEPVALLPEKRPFRFARPPYLPESIAPMGYSFELVQGADSREQCEFFSIQRGDAQC